MSPSQTAIVLIDIDNEFLEARGKLHGAVREVLEQTDAVANINALTHRAREQGVQVIFIPLQFSADYREMGDDPQGIFRVVKEAGALKRDTWGTEVAECLSVEPTDLVLHDKTSTCAFETTDLDRVLRDRGITSIALGGLLTNVCVESTMRTAYDKGYTVYGLTDCSAATDPRAHEATIAHDWPLFAAAVTHRELLDRLA